MVRAPSVRSCGTLERGLCSRMRCCRRENTVRNRGAQVGALLGCMLTLGSLGAGGQTLRGTVVDATTHGPLSGTTVHVQSERNQVRQATTDSAGTFSIGMPAAGLSTVVETRIGYLPHRGDTVRVGDAETVSVEVRLDRNAVPLRPVVVTERTSWLPDGFEQRRAAGFG